MHGALPNAQEFGERFSREFADNAPVMIWCSGTDKLCDWFNKSRLNFVGRTMEQELGYGWTANVHKDDFERCLTTYFASFDARRAFNVIYRLRRHDGVYRHILDTAAPFKRGGEFAGYFGSATDVTEQLVLEAQLRQAQKMEAVSAVASGVAHEVNNILQIMGSNLDLLGRYVAGNPDAEELLHAARVGLARGSKLTSELQAFSRPQAPSPQGGNIRDIFGISDIPRRAVAEPLQDHPLPNAHGKGGVPRDASRSGRK